MTDLDKLALNGDLEGVKALLKGNPDLVFGRGDNDGYWPLSIAAQGGHTEVVQLVLDRIYRT
jgi:hypothetical protein